MAEPVAPTHDDPFVAAGSAAIGGSLGRHARPHPWWTPLRVVLALTTLAGVLNLVHTAPCQSGAWWSGSAYADLCYSDVPLSYVGSGRAEGLAPWDDAGDRYATSTDPALVAGLSWLAATGAQALSGAGAEPASRAAVPLETLQSQPSVQQEATTTYALYAMAMVLAALLVAALLVRLSGRRPWDAAAFAAAPVLVLSATIGWDLAGVALAVGGVAAWSRGRAVLAGGLLGLAAATAVWPVLVLVALGALAVRERSARPSVALLAAAVSGWLLAQLPPLLLADDWWGTVDHKLDGSIGYGSLWRLAAAYGLEASPRLLTGSVLAGVALVLVAVVGVVLGARRRPRLAQVVWLLLAGVLLVWPVYSPQYALWLLPFAVLARPRWRDLLVWQAGEVLYFLAIWWTLSGATNDLGSVDKPYAAAIVVRVAAELWLTAVVVRDVLRPERDPVRADLVTDDPAAGPLAEPALP